MEQIKVIINKENYSIIIDAEGYEGMACLQDVEELQNLLKANTLKEDIKDDTFTVRRTNKVSHKNRY